MDLLEVLGLNRPVAESAVCFEIYHHDISGKSDATSEGISLRCLQLLQPYLDGYIWQHEPLRLQSSLKQQPPWLLKKLGRKQPHSQQQQQEQQQHQQPEFLWGVVRCEDNVEDEWFVVWLLLHLTQQLPGLVARCWDDDGEFLLIEAAYALPRWLKPETATNRVWLHHGQLHIIPPPSAKDPTLPPAPSVSQALAILHSNAVNTRRQRVEACILDRLSGYPSKAQHQLQRVKAWLPLRVALLLQAEPQMVAAAVAAFMSRQREEVQAASKLKLFPPSNMTTARICINRCMYAQLMQADFAPPKAYPSPPGGNWLGGSSTKQQKALGFGVKITTGMELMAARLGVVPQQASTPPPPAAAGATAGTAAEADTRSLGAEASSSTPSNSADTAVASSVHQPQPSQQLLQQQQQLLSDSLAANPAWHSYVSVLQRSGYFDGELEGSARYKQLLAAAQDAFVGSEAHQRSMQALAAPKQRLEHLLQVADAAAGSAAAAASSSQQNGWYGNGVNGSSSMQQQQRSAISVILNAEDASEDGDDWMAADLEELQQQLQQAEALAAGHTAKKQQQQEQQQPGLAVPSDHKQGAAGNGSSSPTGVDAAAVVDAEQLLSGFRGFMQHMAGPEGAEVPGGLHNPASSSNASASTAAPGAITAAEQSAGAVPHQPHVSNSTSKQSRSMSSSKRSSSGRQHREHQHQQANAEEDMGVAFNPDSFLQELLSVLGPAVADAMQDTGSIGHGFSQQQQQQPGPAAAEALLQQLQSLQHGIEQQLAASGQAEAAAGGSGALDEDSDDYGSSNESSDEGSSFYGSEGSEEEADGEELAEAFSAAHHHTAAVQESEPVLLPVPPPVSQKQQGGTQQQQTTQQQQQQWQLPPSFRAQQQQPDKEEAWEVWTATDSDDEADALSLGGSSNSDDASSGDEDELAAANGLAAHPTAGANHDEGAAAGFFESYNTALEAELAATTMAQTFERLTVEKPAAGAAAAGSNSQTGPLQTLGARPNAAGVEAGDAGLAPLDVDFNLIKSLVASYTAQGGLPGPASNLAGLLGIKLPTKLEVDDVDEPQQQQQQGQQQQHA